MPALLDRRRLGQMLVLLTRNIDLSVASVIGLAAYCLGRPAAQPPGARHRRRPGGRLRGRRARLRPAQRARGHRRAASPRSSSRSARYALSRLHQPLGRRQAGQRRPGAAGLARPDQRQVAGVPLIVVIATRHPLSPASCCSAHRPSAASCTRSARTRTARS